MATERKTGAGARLAGVLERQAPPDQADADDVDATGEETASAKGRGPTPKKPRTAEARAAKRIKGRTVYIPDDLFERIIVHAHRRERTISEYVVSILERQVPDHRIVRAGQGGATDAA